ncbi:hypothetical protein ACX80V_05960 [Arthrobacter sp. MDT3-24]
MTAGRQQFEQNQAVVRTAVERRAALLHGESLALDFFTSGKTVYTGV